MRGLGSDFGCFCVVLGVYNYLSCFLVGRPRGRHPIPAPDLPDPPPTALTPVVPRGTALSLVVAPGRSASLLDLWRILSRYF